MPGNVGKVLQQPDRRCSSRLSNQCFSTIVQPVAHELHRMLQRIQQHQLMIARQQNKFISTRPVSGRHCELDGLKTVRSTIDKIAEKNQSASIGSTRDRRDRIERSSKRLCLPMNISDYKQLVMLFGP